VRTAEVPFCPSERRSLARALLLVSWTTLIAVVVVVVGCIEEEGGEEVVSGKERWMWRWRREERWWQSVAQRQSE
jgi:hypothetical protein